LDDGDSPDAVAGRQGTAGGKFAARGQVAGENPLAQLKVDLAVKGFFGRVVQLQFNDFFHAIHDSNQTNVKTLSLAMWAELA